MHVPLDEHLHSDECVKIIRELHKCHEEYSLFRQFLGVCNQADWAMRDCTRGERLERTSDNLEKSKKRNEAIQEKMAQIGDKNWREVLKEQQQRKQENKQ